MLFIAASCLGQSTEPVETLRAVTTPVTLVPVGPLSNIAAALAVEPRITESVDEVVIMGGGHDYGNETASAEFNIWADPEAADVVFAAPWQRLTLVPLDATHRALVSRADCEAFEALGTPAGAALFRVFTSAGLPLPPATLQANSPSMTRAMVLHTDRLALTSRCDAMAEASGGQLRIVPVELPATRRHIGMAIRSIGVPSADLQLLQDALREAARGGGRQRY